YIDPSVYYSGASEWVAVLSTGTSRYKFSGDDGMGRCGTTGSPMYCSTVFTERLVWQFTGLNQISYVAPSDISSAVLSV
ncbi:hypothetical protein, partial [Nocardioides sp.]|uniref:hypothetical protein n=1 Tax=Nocardioides sp. TaxID=35761 RepID=UPI002C5FC352